MAVVVFGVVFVEVEIGFLVVVTTSVGPLQQHLPELVFLFLPFGHVPFVTLRIFLQKILLKNRILL